MQSEITLSMREARAIRSALTEFLCSTAGDRGDAEVERERTVVERLIVRLDGRFGNAVQWSPRLG